MAVDPYIELKAIVNGKRYDTASATVMEVATRQRLGRGDFRFVREGLYRTAKGAWFLAGEGGPMTRYTHHVPGGGMSGGSRIVPLSDGEALDWLEDEGMTEAIERFFVVVDA